MIIEIVSPAPRSTDVITKMAHYAMVGVPNYIIVDRFEQRGVMVRELVGYHLTPAGYNELSPNADGWLWLKPVNLWLDLDGEDLICYDESGKAILNYVGVTAARAEARAAAKAEARVKAEERIRQLEAELRRRIP